MLEVGQGAFSHGGCRKILEKYKPQMTLPIRLVALQCWDTACILHSPIVRDPPEKLGGMWFGK